MYTTYLAIPTLIDNICILHKLLLLYIDRDICVVPVQGLAILQESDIAIKIQIWREKTKFVDELVDVFVKLFVVECPEDWSLLSESNQDRQQGAMQARPCFKVFLASPPLFCEPAMVAPSYLLNL